MKALTKVRANRAATVAKRDVLIAQMESITAAADGESRDRLSADEEREFRSLKADLGRLDAEVAEFDERIAELEAIGERTAAAAGVPTSINFNTRPAVWRLAENASEADARSVAITCVENERFTDDTAKELLVRALEQSNSTDAHQKLTDNARFLAHWAMRASNPDYASAFGKLYRDPVSGSMLLTDAERQAVAAVEELRGMNIATNSTQGQYMMPLSLDPSILLTGSGVTDPMRKIARSVKVTTNKWYGVSSAGVTASWDDEVEQVSDDTPTLAQPTVETFALRVFVPFSIHAEMDIPDFLNEISTVMRDELMVKEGTAFWTGSGTGEPKGVITKLDATAGSEVSIADTSGGTFALADVYSLHEAVPARFRQNATWAANINVLNKTRRFGEGTTGSNSAYWTDLSADTPPLLIGRPIVEASPMDAYAASGSKNLLVLGDFSRYVIADRVGATWEVVPHVFGANGRPTGERGLFAYLRVGGDAVTPEAFRLLKGKS